MNVKVLNSNNTDFSDVVLSDTRYLNVCAHCGECLKQLVAYPNKLNVVVLYRNKKGEYVEWKPKKLLNH